MFKRLQHIQIHSQPNKRTWLFHYFILYTLAFIVMSVLVFASFWLFKITFIWNPDGSGQHIKALTYYGTWLRDIVKSIFNGNFNVAEYNFSLGLGADIIQTLHYYVIGDPLNLLAAVCPYRLYPHLYDFLVLLRLYLGGIAFSLFCLHMKDRSRFALLCGSFVYIFCGFALLSVRHPFFLNPFYQFPLILLGVEHIISGKKPYLLIFSVAIASTSNFFFFYILVLLTVIYVIGRLISLYHASIKAAVLPALKITAFSFTGVLLGAVIFLPVVLVFLSDGRLAAEVNIPLLYSGEYYRSFIAGFIGSNHSLGYWTLLCFSVIALLAIFLLFRRKNKYLLLKVFFLLGTLFLCVPFFAHIFNGMSYVANRWAFGYSMLVAYILVEVWPELISINKKDLYYLSFCLGIYGFVSYILNATSSYGETFVSIMIGFFAIILLAKDSPNQKRRASCILCACVLVSIVIIATGLYSPFIRNNVNSYMTTDEYWYMYYSSPDSQVIALTTENQDPQITRYAGNTNDWNAALTYGTNSIEYYWSLSNPNVTQYRIEFNERENVPYFYKGFDTSTILTNLASVKYYAVALENDDLLPYGYTAVSENHAYAVYENEFALPLGYTYDSYMSQDSYQSLNSIQKQEAQLQSVVMDDSALFQIESVPVFNSEELLYALSTEPYDAEAERDIESDDNAANIGDAENTTKNVFIRDHSFVVTSAGTSVTFLVNGIENSETILSFKNLQFTGATEYDLYHDDTVLDPLDNKTEEYYDWLTPLEQYTIRRKDMQWMEPTTALLKIGAFTATETNWKGLTLATPNYLYYNNRHDFDVNLGYSEEAVKAITIIFPYIGTYSFDDLAVYGLPMTDYESHINALREDTLENIVFQNDTLTGTISLDSPKILCLSIPYSTGWTATVDGEPAELKQANTMYMALELPAGDHEIMLHYETPFLRLGAAISGVTLLAIALTYLVVLIRRKKSNI